MHNAERLRSGYLPSCTMHNDSSAAMALIVDPELPRKYRRLRHVIRERVRTAAAPCVGWEWDIVFMLDLDPAHGIALLSRAHDVAVARRWKTAPCAPRLPPT